MRLEWAMFAAGAAVLLAAAGPGAWAVAGLAESAALRRGEAALAAAGAAGWARLSADGLLLRLTGEAPDRLAAAQAEAATAGAAPLARLESAIRVAEAAGAGAFASGAAAAASAPETDRAAPSERIVTTTTAIPGPVGSAAGGSPDANRIGAAAPPAPAPAETVQAAPPPEGIRTMPAGGPIEDTASAAEAGRSASAADDGSLSERAAAAGGEPDALAQGPGATAAGGEPGALAQDTQTAEGAAVGAENAASASAPPPDAADLPFAMIRDAGALTLAGPAPPGFVLAAAEALAALPEAPTLRDATLPTDRSASAHDAALVRAAARALAGLPSGKAELGRGVLRLSAAVADAEARAALDAALRADAPPGAILLLDLTTPPPVIAPFRFVLTLGPEGATLLGCDLPSEAARADVAEALVALGADRLARTCRIGVGAPSSRWTEAAAAGAAALAAAGAGRFDMVDVEARLVAAPGVAPARFEAAAKSLAAAMPEGMALRVTAPRRARPRPAGEDGPEDWFAAALGPEGARLTGAAPDPASAAAAAAYARARFGAAAVSADFAAAEAAPPPAWRRAGLALIDGLAALDRGEARFDGEVARLSGTSDGPAAVRAVAAAARNLAAAGVPVETAVTVDLPALAERLPLPPLLCLARLAEIVEADPIGFAPGSAEIEAGSAGTLDRLAATLARCPAAVVEIEGHTDSQGRESTNLRLSEARAAAVLDALMARGTPYRALRSTGYGEARPIADNATEAGRARNRRIEFSEVGPATAEALR